MDTLTTKEYEVLRLASRSLSNWEISQSLKITPQAVCMRIKRASKKLGARNRTHAVLMFSDRAVSGT